MQQFNLTWRKKYHGGWEIYLNQVSTGECIRNSEDLNNKDIEMWAQNAGQVGHEYRQTQKSNTILGEDSITMQN